MRDLCVVVGESYSGVGAGGEYGDPDEAVAEVGPEQRGDDDRDDDEQSAHGGRAGFFLMRLRAFFADVLADLEIAQAVDNERADNECGEKRREAGKRRAERDVTENAEWRNVMLQLEE